MLTVWGKTIVVSEWSRQDLWGHSIILLILNQGLGQIGFEFKWEGLRDRWVLVEMRKSGISFLTNLPWFFFYISKPDHETSCIVSFKSWKAHIAKMCFNLCYFYYPMLHFLNSPVLDGTSIKSRPWNNSSGIWDYHPEITWGIVNELMGALRWHNSLDRKFNWMPPQCFRLLSSILILSFSSTHLLIWSLKHLCFLMKFPFQYLTL